MAFPDYLKIKTKTNKKNPQRTKQNETPKMQNQTKAKKKKPLHPHTERATGKIVGQIKEAVSRRVPHVLRGGYKPFCPMQTLAGWGSAGGDRDAEPYMGSIHHAKVP